MIVALSAFNLSEGYYMKKEEVKRSPFADVVPTPDYNFIIPDDEDFAQWAEHPITRFVAACFEKAAEANQKEWEELSWVQGTCSSERLLELRTRADAYMAFLQTSKEHYVNIIK